MTRVARGFYRGRRRTGRFKDVVLTLSFLFLLILIAARLQNGASDPVSGPFRVVDGDTLAAGAERLRLVGIDAPELEQTCERDGKVWACGEEAKAELKRVMEQGTVKCHGGDRDRYGRLLVNCFVADTAVQSAMVRAGMAVTTSLVAYRGAQSKAEMDRKGIWSGTFIMPAEWRRERRQEREGSGFLAVLKNVLSLNWL